MIRFASNQETAVQQLDGVSCCFGACWSAARSATTTVSWKRLRPAGAGVGD